MATENRSKGYSLIELMITVAIIFIVAGIAIPLYQGYVREAHYTAMRATIDTLRTPLEDFRLENGSYGPVQTLVGENDINNRFGWEPGSDTSAYTYTVAVVATNNYHVWGTSNATSVWVRCENRMSNCCESDAGGATGPSAACP